MNLGVLECVVDVLPDAVTGRGHGPVVQVHAHKATGLSDCLYCG